MAAVPMRCTWFYQSYNAEIPVGWSETLWAGAPQDQYKPCIDDAVKLAKLRLPFLGGGYKISYIRVSKEGVYRDSQIVQLDMRSPNPNKLEGPEVGDFAYSVCLVRMESGPLNRRSMYISGVADAKQTIMTPGRSIFDAGPAADWATEIKGKWAWYGFKKNADDNKTHRVWIPPAPPVTEKGYWDYPLGRTLYLIDNVQARRFGSHRRGRPFDLLRGRSSVRHTPA